VSTSKELTCYLWYVSKRYQNRCQCNVSKAASVGLDISNFRPIAVYNTLASVAEAIQVIGGFCEEKAVRLVE